MGGAASYLYYTEEETEIPIDEKEHISYVTQREFRLIKTSEDKYYSIYEGEYLTEKKIPRGSYFTVVKIIKTKAGSVRILGQFDQESELIDVAMVFNNVNPLIPSTGCLRDALTTSLFIPANSKNLRQNIFGNYRNSY